MKEVQEARAALYGEVSTLFKEKNRFGIEAATGTGKTKIALDLIDEAGGTWDIVCPTQAVVEAWEEEIVKHGKEHLRDQVHIYCYASLHKHIDKRGTNYVLDEAHRVTENRLYYIKENLRKDSKIIALSATVDWEKKELLAELGINSYHKFSTDDAVESGFITDYTIWVYKIALGTEPTNIIRFKKLISEKAAYAFVSKKVQEAQRRQDWKGLGFFAIWRKQILSTAMSKERVAQHLISKLPTNRNTLVFAGSIEQSDRLVPDASYHSKGDQGVLDYFKSEGTNIMSSVGKIVEGVNVQADIILKLGIDKKERALVQTLGRALRLNPNDPDKKAVAVVLVSEGTVEEQWMEESVSNFRDVKIQRWER